MHNEYSVLIMLIGSLMVYSVLAQKINKYAVTGPMFMAFMGLIYAFSSIESQNTSIALDAYQMMIELTLAFILFNDAAKTKLSVLEHSYAYPL